jgi:hypothetical protein
MGHTFKTKKRGNCFKAYRRNAVVQSSKMIYYGYKGFVKKDKRVLDELLPKWNAKVSPMVERVDVNVEVREVAAVAGSGLFSVDGMARGEIFSYYGGELSKGMTGRSPYDMDTRMKVDYSRKKKGVTISHVFVNGRPTAENSNKASLINHACRPNCQGFYQTVRVGSKATGRSLTLQLIRFEALRNILPDEELTIDYGREYVENRSTMRPNTCYTACMCNGGRCPFRRMMRPTIHM